MKQVLETLNTLGLNTSAIVFGFVGALLHALRVRDKHWAERLVAFGVGFFLAAAGTPALIRWLGLANEPTYYSSLGFVLGYFGMALVDACSEAIADWKGLLAAWLNRNPKEPKDPK
jgi:hypothetical protein